MGTEVKVFENEADAGARMVALIVAIAAEAIQKKNSFYLGLSGGSAAKLFCENIINYTCDWNKWNVLFCDERFVDINDAESTYGYYKQHFFDKVPIKAENILKITTSHESVKGAAKEYEESMRLMFQNPESLPEIDALMLGFGPDGHTCSLFPHHKLLDETSKWVGSLSDSPKPPPSRITLTYPVINNAANIIFFGCGLSKAPVVKRIMEKPSKEFPASLVRPKVGRIHWILDTAASSQIQITGKQEL